MRRSESGRSAREPVGTIPAGWWPAYIWIFAAKILSWTALVTRYHVMYGGHGGFTETARAVVSDVAIGIPVAMASTTILLEGVKVLMITAEYLRAKYLEPLKQSLRDEGREEGLEEGLEQGREEMRVKAAVWYAKQKEAAEKGEPFDEPPPWESEE